MGEIALIPIDQRSEQILDRVGPLESLDVTLAEARGCLVDEDVVATRPWPHYSSCSTSGFAARSADATQGSLLSVIGRASAEAVKASADADADAEAEADADKADADADTGKTGEDSGEGKSGKAKRSRRFRRNRKSGTSDPGKHGEPRKPGVADADDDVVESIDPGQVVEVHVGAPLPVGADAVLPFDAVKVEDDSVLVKRAAEPGQGVSAEGSIASEGTLLIPGRTFIDARRVGILSAIGLSRVTVVPRPRVVIVSVGDDLVSDTAEMGSTHKHDATSTLLASAAAAAGAVPYRVAPVPDVPELVAESLDDQLIRADVIVVCGPISSPSDTIREVLGRIGDVSYDEGATNLGVFGTGFLGDEGTHVISLPRDPVVAYLLFRVLVDPIIAGMLGFRIPEWNSADLGADVPLSSDRSQFLLASIDDRGRVEPATGASRTLVDLQNADAMIRLSPGSGTQRRGSTVAALMLVSESEPA